MLCSACYSAIAQFGVDRAWAVPRPILIQPLDCENVKWFPWLASSLSTLHDSGTK